MKVGVRVNAPGFQRAEALVAGVRRRAIARAEAEVAAQMEHDRLERDVRRGRRQGPDFATAPRRR